METFDKWFTRFMWGTDIVLLAASTPHIATWYQHFDNASDPISAFYSWLVGYGLAIAIDGVSLMLLYAMIRTIKHGTKGKGTILGILLFMGFIMSLSWFINWQYDLVYGSTSFAKADSMTITVFRSITIGQLNPIIGGAFSVLMMAYAIIAKAVRSEAPMPEMSDQEFEARKRRLQQEQELANLRKSGNETGWINKGKEQVFGKGKDQEALYATHLNTATDYLRDATELLDPSQEEKALEILSSLLKISRKQAAVFLVQVRSVIAREKAEEEARKQENIREEKEEELSEDSSENVTKKRTTSLSESGENYALDPDVIYLLAQYPGFEQLLDTGSSTLTLAESGNIFGKTATFAKNRADAGDFSYAKGRKSVYKSSVIKWAKRDLIAKGNRKIISFETVRNSEEQSGEIRDEKVGS